jgi:hypothetical protein
MSGLEADTIGGFNSMLKKQQKKAGEAVVTTDGMENASRKFSSEQIRKMIKKEKKKHGWEFLFLGANIDAVATAKQYGICAGRAASYRADPAGTRLNYEAVGSAISGLRANKKLSPKWKEDIDRDFSKRA